VTPVVQRDTKPANLTPRPKGSSPETPPARSLLTGGISIASAAALGADEEE
jgi:hypothetical protein